MNQSIFFDDYEIIFSEVLEDSRCPIDVTCIWEGCASIKLDVKNEKKIQEIILATGERTTAYFDSYEISMVNILPYPISTKTVSTEEYSAIISISNISEKIIPPLKQIKSGISFENIQCKKDNPFVLIQKIDGSPACVKPEIISKLIERG